MIIKVLVGGVGEYADVKAAAPEAVLVKRVGSDLKNSVSNPLLE